MTQREQVLKALRAAGSRGVHTHELRAAYIANPSQRISELEAEGHLIVHTRERLHGRAIGTRYKLIEGVQAGSARGPGQRVADPAPPLTLDLDLKPAPQSAIYGYEDAA